MLNRKWWTLGVVSAASFMLLLNITSVIVALPVIQTSLRSSLQGLQWVIDAYSLTLAVFLLSAGVFSDTFGRRKVFVVGLSIFTLASLACGLSSSALILDLARGGQGLGDAAAFAASLALIADAFEGRARALAFGTFGAVTGVGISVGPLVGGAITSSLGWRWLFLVNVPIGVLITVLAMLVVRESRRPDAAKVDWLGLLTFSVALVMLVYALLRGTDTGWRTSGIIGLLTASALLLVGFVMVELPPHGRHRTRRYPMVDLSLFRRMGVCGISVVAFTAAAALVSPILYLTLYLQDDLGLSPLAVGVRLLPFTLLALVVAPVAGRLLTRVPTSALLGVALLAVSFGLLLMARVQPDSGWTVLLPGFIAAGAGFGAVNTVLANAAVSAVPMEQSGMGAGLNQTFWQLGLATGVAVLGDVFENGMRHSTIAALSSSSAGREVVRGSSAYLLRILPTGSVAQVAPSLADAERRALVAAYHVGFAGTLHRLLVLSAAISFVGAVAAFLFVRQRDLARAPGTSPTPQGEGSGEPASRLAPIVDDLPAP